MSLLPLPLSPPLLPSLLLLLLLLLLLVVVVVVCTAARKRDSFTERDSPRPAHAPFDFLFL